MPRVRMLTDVAGPDHVWRRGQVVDMTPQQANAWADGDRGVVVRGDRPETTDDTPSVETTARRSRARKKG